ncbi:MAG TPA: spore germination protein GerW family protein [bacterium]|nr:spore germination protein GerW family protein [bacterium]
MMIDRLADRIKELHDRAGTRTVFGDPVELRGRTIVPVARVCYAFGMGMGHGRKRPEGDDGMVGEGGGGGGGVSVKPLAVVEVTDTAINVVPIVDATRLALVGMALAAWGVFWVSRALRARHCACGGRGPEREPGRPGPGAGPRG